MQWFKLWGILACSVICICLVWYFQSLSKYEALCHLNCLITLFSYEWLLILPKLDIGRLCMFVFDSGAYLVSEVMKFKLCLVSWFQFRSSNVYAVSIHTLYVLAFVVFRAYFLLLLAANFICVAHYRNAAVRIRSQPAITCSKLTIETLEQGLKYVQS